jgi:MFS transporter, putative metabolite:H+ symporter
MGQQSDIAARFERLPLSRFHMKLASVLALVTFFDGYDAMTIAYILPVLLREWSITPGIAAGAIAAGYLGQAVGATAFGFLAQSKGRRFALITATLILALGSGACALAPNIIVLGLARFIQGLGLGGELPVAATYVSEMAGSRNRPRLFFLYQASFGFGIAAAALAGTALIPVFGWRPLLWLGMVPILLIPLVRRYCPESPLWLASRQQHDLADRTMTWIEKETVRYGHVLEEPVPVASSVTPPGRERWTTLFASGARRLMIGACGMWMCAAAITYGIGVWLPTILTSIYHVELAQALRLSAMATSAVLVVPLIMVVIARRFGRRAILAAGFALGAASLMLLASGLLKSIASVMLVATITQMAVSAVAATLYLYTPELFAVPLRSMATGIASTCQRISLILTPLAIGRLLDGNMGLAVFWSLAAMAAIGALLALVAGRETRAPLNHGEGNTLT